MNAYTTNTPSVGYAIVVVLALAALVTLVVITRFFFLRARAIRRGKVLDEAKRLLSLASRPAGNLASSRHRSGDRHEYRAFVLVSAREDLAAALGHLKDPIARRALPEDDPDRKIADLVFGDETVP